MQIADRSSLKLVHDNDGLGGTGKIVETLEITQWPQVCQVSIHIALLAKMADFNV